MTTNTNEVLKVKRYFDIKNIHASNYWLECCVEWFKDSHVTYSEQELFEVVLEQWLECDICEIEVRSLPPNLSKEKHLVLNGNYAVQLMYVKDISRSSLSQLKGIRDMYKLTRGLPDNDNEPNSGTGKRVLYLYLTDGVQYIFGFEYQPLRVLNLNVCPGIKLLLTGPLLIRNGEILLKDNNIKILGGQVEALLIPNCVENVLARELKMPENKTPGKLNALIENNATNTVTQNCNNNLNQTNVEHVNNMNEVLSTQRSLNTVQSTQNNRVNTQMTQGNLNQAQKTKKNNQTTLTTAIRNQQRNQNETQLLTTQNSTINDSFDDDLIFTDFDPPDFVASARNENLDSVEDEEFMNIDIDNLQKPNTERLTELLSQEQDFDFNIEDELEMMEQIDNDIEQESIVVPIIENAEPFVYIAQLLEHRAKITNQKYRVKARFKRVIQKLSVNKKRGWYMQFEIMDHTGRLEVDFISEVLEDMTGLTAAAAINEKCNAQAKNSSSYEKLLEAINRCKSKLQTIDGLIDLQFKDDTEMPTIVLIESIKKSHLEDLKSRVDKSNVIFN